MAKVTKMQVTYYEVDIPETLEAFKEWEFTSGSHTGKDFVAFAGLYKRHIKTLLPPGGKLVVFNRGHYDLFGFVQYEDRYVYFSISDVRFFKGHWHSQILIRTAKSAEDYTGGGNNYTTLEKFSLDIARLIKAEAYQESLI